MSSVRRRSTRRSGVRGATLVEALAAIGLLAVGIFPFTSSSVLTTRTMKTADSVSTATALAQEKLEQLRSMPLGAAQVASGTYVDPANPLRPDGATGGLFSRSWIVSAKDTPQFGLKTVTVTIAWRDPLPHTSRLAAYIRCSTVPCP